MTFRADRYKAVVFDFDGTLVESVPIKTAAYARLFEEWENHRDEIRTYHLRNEGLSRRIKIPYVYEHILKIPISDEELDSLADRYSGLVFDKMLSCPFVDGALELLKSGKGDRKYFIASGTPKDELRKITGVRGIDDHFEGIYGSPPTKVEIVKRINARTGIPFSAMLFVGDAQSDYNAALKCGLDFVGRRRPTDASGIADESAQIEGENITWVADMGELKEILEGVEG